MFIFKKKGAGSSYYERQYPDKVIAQRLMKYIKPYKGDIILLVILTLFNSAAALVYPIGMTKILNAIENKDMHQLSIVSLWLLGVIILSFFSQRAYQYNINKLGQYILYDLRSDLFTHIQRQSFEFHNKIPTGKLMSRITNDVDMVQGFISAQLIQFIGDVFLTITTFIIMLIWSWQLTFTIMAVFPLIAVVFSYAAQRSRYYYRKQRGKIAELTRMMQETIAGIKTVKAFVKEDQNIKNFDIRNRENMIISMKAAKISAIMEPIKALIMAASLGIVITLGVRLMESGALKLDILLGYVLLVTQFVTPLNRIGDFYNNVQSAFASGDRILSLLDMEPTIKEKPNAITMPPIKGEVEYRHVWFEYEKGLPVLKDINFKTKKHERYAFVGFTGAGKSTLVSLLSRFYDPTEGDIFIDGINIKDVTLESLRSQIGVVLQDTFLFDGTVMDNIRYGKLDATDEEVIEASKKVGAHPFIMNLPEQYDTNIRERGSLLSIGQRQLIAFARALLADPPILVLDEATSSVDPYTELKIQEALDVLLKERTSFIIAHRLSTILNADVICVMENGRIIQRGTHEELIEQGGLYKHLYELQFKRPEEKKSLAERKTS